MLLKRAMAELGPVTKEKASLEKTALMSIIVLLCLLFGVAAILLLVLFFLQRRQLNALELISQQVQQVVPGDAHNSRIELHTDQPELAGMVAAVNRLMDASPRRPTSAHAPRHRSARWGIGCTKRC